VLRNELGPAPAEAAAALGVTEGAGVHHLERLRFARGRPVAYLTNYVPEGLLNLDTARLEATGLYRLLRAAGLTLHSARQSVGASSATPEEAARLEEPEGAALLTMRRTAYDHTGRALEYGSHQYRASCYTFDFHLLARS
jgi:GntR family transcriptional regulator